MFKPRRNQEEILAYKSGMMGISAVPGSGKTHTLSYLAAQLILKSGLQNDQEILIVTLVNSAVDNFANRIAGFVQEAGLLVNVGYRVRTLHGLAHDILQERPDLAGISNQFSINDELESFRMIEQISTAYLHSHPEIIDYLLKADVDYARVSRGRYSFPSYINTLNRDFISMAKDLEALPEDILLKMQQHDVSNPLLEMAVEVYQQYQRGLRYRNALDFSDLIRLAYLVLKNDEDYLFRLRYRWPFVLEDEAQDSSNLQEKLLRLLVGESGNWVRVGDPNQAIYETFTTADPMFLKRFLKETGVVEKTLPHSGRSNQSIIRLANSLIQWSRSEHPVQELQGSLDLPLIETTPPGDPQPNPPDHPLAIYIKESKYTAEEEIKFVVRNIQAWLKSNPDKTVAVLCPTGHHGERAAEELRLAGIPMVELLNSSQSTRRVAAIIAAILQSLAEPGSAQKLSQSVEKILTQDNLEDEAKREIKKLAGGILKILRLEDLLFPLPGNEWSETIDQAKLSPHLMEEFSGLRIKLLRWQEASFLPIDQLVLTIANDLFTIPADLAMAHKFALLLEFASKLHPEYELKDFARELSEISGSIRKISGFSDEEMRFDPDAHKGKVFVSTYHKAKGLEWDRVYLLSVNNYDFPSAQPFDSYIGEKWFIRENFNPQAELLSRLKGLITDNKALIQAPDGLATQNSRLEYASERLRLLFVGITRARHSLGITWNTGKNKEQKMSLPLSALHAIWKGSDEAS